jgi:hypothetical protein
METRQLKTRFRRRLNRVKYAANGAAIGAAIGALVSREAASSSAAMGALVGAIVGENRALLMVDELKAKRGENELFSKEGDGDRSSRLR